MKILYELLRAGRQLPAVGSTSFLLVVMLSFVSLSSQELLAKGYVFQEGKVITGNVTDEEGVSLPGVNILEKGTTNGTVSDANGNYRISVLSSNAILVFSYVGAQTEEVPSFIG